MKDRKMVKIQKGLGKYMMSPASLAREERKGVPPKE